MPIENTKILLTNYPRVNQSATFQDVSNENNKIDIVCGYDVDINARDITVRIASDLITAILSFDKVYVEGANVWYIIKVFGLTYVKELLRLHILCIIPDQELNPVMIKHNDGKWEHSFFPYPQKTQKTHLIGSSDDVTMDPSYRWNHIETVLKKHKVVGLDASSILYLLDENAVDIGNVENIKEQINSETDKDIINPLFLNDKNFYKISDGLLYYNQLSRIRLQEMNKSVILAANLDINTPMLIASATR